LRPADLLLQLEAALGMASPPEAAEARRAWKLLAMKAALEGRGGAEPANHAGSLLVDLLARPHLGAAERERLRGVVSALRQQGPERWAASQASGAPASAHEGPAAVANVPA
jgi:hypothetical protein